MLSGPICSVHSDRQHRQTAWGPRTPLRAVPNRPHRRASAHRDQQKSMGIAASRLPASSQALTKESSTRRRSVIGASMRTPRTSRGQIPHRAPPRTPPARLKHKKDREAYLSGAVDVRDIGGDSGAATDVEERELGDERVLLEEERQRLSDSTWAHRKIAESQPAGQGLLGISSAAGRTGGTENDDLGRGGAGGGEGPATENADGGSDRDHLSTGWTGQQSLNRPEPSPDARCTFGCGGLGRERHRRQKVELGTRARRAVPGLPEVCGVALARHASPTAPCAQCGNLRDDQKKSPAEDEWLARWNGQPLARASRLHGERFLERFLRSFWTEVACDHKVSLQLNAIPCSESGRDRDGGGGSSLRLRLGCDPGLVTELALL